MIRYGLPFMGSKNRLAKDIIDMLPPADVFIDLFAGGGALSHAALLSGKYKKVVANDITDSVILFKEALDGTIDKLFDWVSRQEFYALKDTDPRIRILWSYANNQTDYLYGKEAENYKMHAHNVIFARDSRERYAEYREAIRLSQEITKGDPQNLQILQHLQYAYVIQDMKCPGLTKNLEITQMDYREVEIPENALVYADPPYDGTHGYNYDFSTKDFISWAESVKNPMLVSERSLPFPVFKEFSIPDVSTPVGRPPVSEKLYAFNLKGTKIQRSLF